MSNGGGGTGRFIDTSGERPRLRVFALVSVMFGTVAYGYILGVVDAILSVGGGINDVLADFGRWRVETVAGLVGIPAAVINSAWESHTEWIVSLGVWAQPFAALEVTVITIVVVGVVNIVLRWAL